MRNKIILTKQGLEKVKKELEELQTVQRPLVAKRINQAKGYGDLSENVEYDEAKNEQMILEKRISELRKTIKKAEVPSQNSDGEAGVGSTVVIDCEGEETEYQLVGNFEADPLKGKISHSSPIGKSLMGCKEGEEVELDIPAGAKKCQVKSIK